MPDVKRTDVIIQAHDKASSILNHIGKRLGILSKEGLAMGVAFAGVNLAIGAVSQGFAKLQEWIDGGIRKFREFDKTMSEVATMLSQMDERYLPGMRKSIEEMSIVFGKSAVDLGRAMYQILSAGVEASGAVDVLRASAKLATATLTDVETAVDAVTTVLNAYGMSAQQVDYITNIMAKTIQLGKLRMDELAGSLGYVVPIAAKAGVSFEEISAAIATLTKQGIDAHMASRGLRQVLNTLISPTEESKEAMVNLGISYDDLTLRALGLQGTLNLINEATSGQIGLISQLIPNVRALTAALGLMANRGEILSNSVEYIKSEFDALDEMYNDVSKSSYLAQKRIEMLHDAVDRGIGEAVEPANRAWNEFWAAFKIGVTKVGWLSILPTSWPAAILRGYEEIGKKYKEAEKSTEKTLATEKVEAYSAAFERLNNYIKEQLSLVKEMRQRQELYREELENLAKQRDILVQTHKYKEALYYIPLALKDATYTSKIFDEQTRALVDSIRLQREEIERLEHVNKLYNMEIQANSIESMRIQLAAMRRHGRMTREEKRRLEELRMADLQKRIEMAENQLKIDEIKNKGLSEEEKRLEKIKLYYNEYIKNVTDAYGQELNILNTQIKYKEKLIEDYNNYIGSWDKPDSILGRAYTAWKTFYDELSKLDLKYKVKLIGKIQTPPTIPGAPTPTTLTTGSDRKKGIVVSTLPSIIRGIKRTVNVKVEPITVNANIQSDTDLNNLGSKIGQLIATGIISGLQSEHEVG